MHIYPLVLGPDKKRLSKRHAATSLEEYKAEGYLDSAILNTLARLGWSKGDQEVFYMNDLIKNFNINEVQKAGAIFDITKLDWLNSQHLSNLSMEDFKKHLVPFLEEMSININDHFNQDALINAMKTSSNTLRGIAQELRPYYLDVENYDQKALDKFIGDDGKQILSDLLNILGNVTQWDENNLDHTLKSYQTEKNYSVPQVNQPIRIALTGSTKSPSLGLTLYLVGKENSLDRLSKLLNYLTN